jgi:hypothetical protein
MYHATAPATRRASLFIIVVLLGLSACLDRVLAQPIPVARFTFDDGTAGDSSGNNLNGALIGNAQIIADSTRPFAGAGNKVLSLDGQSSVTGTNQSYVNISDSGGMLNFSGTGNATVMAWVFVKLTKSHNAIFSQGEWRNGASLTVKGDTSPVNLLWAGRTSPAESFNSFGAVPLQQWMHVAVTWSFTGSNTLVTFYTNGVANGTFTMTGTLQAPINGSAIGREWRDATPADLRWAFNGLIDDLRVYKTNLAAGDIAVVASGANLPQILIGSPADGTTFYPSNAGIQFSVTTIGPQVVPAANIHLSLNGTDVSGNLLIGGTATNRTASFPLTLNPNQTYAVVATASDTNGNSAARSWSFDTIDPRTLPPGALLDLTSFATVRETGDPSAPGPAILAVDGNLGTFSETPDVTNSFWEIELNRPCRILRVELVPPAAGGYAGIDNGLVLRIYDLRDRTLFQTTVDTSGGGTWFTNLPVPIDGRIVRFALENGQANGLGDHRVALGEVRLYGDPSPSLGPVVLGAIGKVVQSSTNGAAGPARAIDGNPATFSETLDQTNSWWTLTLDQAQPIQSVQIVNRSDAANAARLQGLTLRILDDNSNSIVSTLVSNPGASNNWIYTPPSGTVGRHVRIGLENGATNGQGDHIVSLAEVSLLTATNLARGAYPMMTRSTDTLLPTANVNDGNYSTAVLLNNSTVDGFFEVDLGQTRALYSIRAVSADGMQSRVAHTTVSLFDEAHDTVFQQHLSGSNEIFDVEMPGPVLARYVRVGLENKERTSPTGGTEWWFGLKELEAYGRASSEVGVLDFSSTNTDITGGSAVDLTWQEADLYELNLYPGIGSVGGNTASNGSGSLSLMPSGSTEYLLAGSNYSGNFTRQLTITVDGQSLPPRINEFVADNQLSLKDGNNNASDWIELHNPNNTTLDLTGCYLSDKPGTPAGWQFPAGSTIAAHGYLIVFADSAIQSRDPAGFLHANFSLSKDGESIVLTASDGTTTLDSIINFPPQSQDLAYGRDVQGAWKFMEPTPGAPNLGANYVGWLGDVSFSRARGWCSNAFSLTITDTNVGSQLLYSIDGTEPSVPYAGPVAITSTVCVRATPVRAGYKLPRIQTHSYLFVDDILASPVMNTNITGNPAYTSRLRQGLTNLPTLCITVPPPVDPSWNGDRVEREASMELFLPDGSAPIQANCGFLHFGGAFGAGPSNPYSKKSWQLDFRSKYGTSKLKAPLFHGFERGLGNKDSFDEIDLHAGNQDMSQRGFYLSDRFAADTMIEMGTLNPHGRFVHLYINGVYWGQYDARERLTAAFLGEYLGGPKENYLTVKGNDNGPGGNFILGVPDLPDGSAWEIMRTNSNSYVAVKDRLDVTNLIDFMLVWNWGNAEAEFRAAGARAPGGPGGFKFWLADADGDLRNQSGVAAALTHDTTANTGPALIFGALFSEGHPDFKTLLADRVYKHFFNNGALTPSANLVRMNLRMNEITNSMVDECARWTSMNGRTPENWLADAQYARDNLLPARTTNLFNQVRARGWYPTVDAPQLNQFGGTVTNGFQLTFSNATGVVYYTLDGSDPRLSGGAISSGAIAWNGQPVVLQTNTQVRVRVFDGTTWSAVVDSQFFIVAPPAAHVDYSGQVYTQDFNSLPNPGAASVNANNPVTISGVTYVPGNPLDFAAAISPTPGGLGLVNTMSGWYGLGQLQTRLGAHPGDQTTGGIISFGLNTGAGTNRALGLLATSSVGYTAFGVKFVNTTSNTLNYINVSVTGELWRQSDKAKTLQCFYLIDPTATNGFSINATASLPQLNVIFPTSAGASGGIPVDGTAPANQSHLTAVNQAITSWPAGAALWLVWEMASPTGTSQGMGVDNLSFSASTAPIIPTLGIVSSGSNVTLYWPAVAVGFTLQGNPDLRQSNGWFSVGPATLSNDLNLVTIPMTPSNQFFRLKQ